MLLIPSQKNVEPVKNNVVRFQGLTFDTLISKFRPRETLTGNVISEKYNHLLNFFEELYENGLLDGTMNSGCVILADDQYAIQQQIKVNFNELKIRDKLLGG